MIATTPRPSIEKLALLAIRTAFGLVVPRQPEVADACFSTIPAFLRHRAWEHREMIDYMLDRIERTQREESTVVTRLAADWGPELRRWRRALTWPQPVAVDHVLLRRTQVAAANMRVPSILTSLVAVSMDTRQTVAMLRHEAGQLSSAELSAEVADARREKLGCRRLGHQSPVARRRNVGRQAA